MFVINFLFIFAFFNQDYSIKDIKFIGNFSVERETLVSIMMLEAEQRYSVDELGERLILLKNSGLFYSVDYIENQNSANLYTIELKEKTTINAFIHYNSSSNLSKLSFGLQERNLFNKYILIASHFDYVESKLSESLWLEYPFIIKNIDLLLSVYQHRNTDFYYSEDKSYPLQIERLGVKTGLRYHFNKNIRFEGEYERFNEDYMFNNDFVIDQIRNKRFHFEKSSYHLSAHYSNLEKQFYSMNGLELSNYFKFYQHKEDPSYSNNLLRISYFKSEEKLTYASRLMLGASEKSDYLYPFTSDGLSTIRASKFNEKRGQYSIIANLETRYAFWDEESFYLQAIAFIDHASLFINDLNIFNEANPRSSEISSYGLGFRVELKKWYNALFRIDFPIRNNNLEILFGVGQFF